MRLGGTGSSENKGYVQGLGTNGVWGGVCGDYFGMNDAHVVCKMLGFPTATAALGYPDAFNLYGKAPSGHSFVLDNLECTGNEASVIDCLHKGKWNEDCDADEIAGVQCATGQL